MENRKKKGQGITVKALKSSLKPLQANAPGLDCNAWHASAIVNKQDLLEVATR
jgi:hypothetical protein